jgi:hypothetical protein
MKFCYKAVWDVYEEMEQEMLKEGRAFCVIYAKNEVNHQEVIYVKNLNNLLMHLSKNSNSSFFFTN